MNKGFTFVELMITVSIMLLLLMLSFPFYTSINKKLTIDRAATRLVQDIRRTQEMSMSAQEFNNSYPKGGYGMYFSDSSSNNKYYIFADVNGNHIYDSGELVEEVKIEGTIKITGKTTGFNDVTFLAPEPRTFLTNSSGLEISGTQAFVLFSDGSNNNYIYINKAGLTYIQ
jgi:prepilin-type N-terminal cleavage/methylation domain-containing protein